MSVIFAGLDIEGKYVEIFSEVTGEVKLVLVGLREDGEKLQELFRDFKKGRVIQIADNLTFKNSGVWKLKNIEFTKESEIYRVKMDLTQRMSQNRSIPQL